jgi:hypothetical protein
MWLALADLLASLGVFVRSMLWISNQTLIPTVGNDTSLIFCFATSVSIFVIINSFLIFFYMINEILLKLLN